jgi:hypothetical protein
MWPAVTRANVPARHRMPTRRDHTAGIIRSWQPLARWSPRQGTLSRLDAATSTRIITRRMTPDPTGPTLHTV